MKKIIFLFTLIQWSLICFSQNSYYLDGIGFEHPKKTKVSSKTDNGALYIFAGNVTIIKSNIDEDKQLNADQELKKIANEIEETGSLPIIQRDEITTEKIGTQSIEAKSITITYKKKTFNRFYAFIQKRNLIIIITTGIAGKTDKSTKMILDSFYYMPEH